MKKRNKNVGDILTDKHSKNKSFWFWCPGCNSYHSIVFERPTKKFIGEDGKEYKNKGPTWEFNGDLIKPTVKPSIKTWWGPKEEPERNLCHSRVTDGEIRFLKDCTHKLKGQTVKLR